MRHDPIRTPSPIELAYMAGYFDGEGCVCMPKARQITATVQSGDKESVGLFAEIFGGWFYETDPCVKNQRRRMWRWQLTGNKAQKFLITILPLLRAKKSVAQLAILPNYGKPGTPVTNDELTLRQDVCAKLQAINRRVEVEWGN